MPTPMTNAQRYCSKCSLPTVLVNCPHDGAPTFTRGAGDGIASLKLAVGAVIADKYKVVKQLGKGGFGAVYQAEHATTGQQVAIKVLALDPDDGDESVVARFLQEAQVTGKLKHPNTVRVFDFGQTTDSSLFMVLELLNGPTLEQVLKDNAKAGQSMSERQACTVAIAVLRSLTEAHEAGLVHRDLKPLNIMLADSGDDEPVVKVLDFGIARKQDSDLTGAGKALGTPAYMSPEQCRGGQLDGRSDLYAVGVILFRCVTGELPFQHDNQLALLQAQIMTPPPPVASRAKSALSPGFAAVVDRALVKEPTARFESARVMRLELEAVIGGAWGGTPMRSLTAVTEVETADTAAVDTGQLAAATKSATMGLAAGITQPHPGPARMHASQDAATIAGPAMLVPTGRGAAVGQSGQRTAVLESPTPPPAALAVPLAPTATPAGPAKKRSPVTAVAVAAVAVAALVGTWLATRPAGPKCGDAKCDPGENTAFCAADCPAPIVAAPVSPPAVPVPVPATIAPVPAMPNAAATPPAAAAAAASAPLPTPIPAPQVEGAPAAAPTPPAPAAKTAAPAVRKVAKPKTGGAGVTGIE